MKQNGNLLDVRNLKTSFFLSEGVVQAVDGVSLRIEKGESLGLVGESGCGKSTIGKCVLKLLEPTEGKILFTGKDINAMGPSEIKDYRRKVQAIFQDPYSSLNPRMSAGEIVEVAKDKELYTDPLHPYTRALMSAVPVPEPRRKKKRIVLRGEVPSPINPPSGCGFHPRCFMKESICSREDPPFRLMGSDHWVACHSFRITG
jgi:oligopeptide/dipeptide ABC transporter ATP-binding protein